MAVRLTNEQYEALIQEAEKQEIGDSEERDRVWQLYCESGGSMDPSDCFDAGWKSGSIKRLSDKAVAS